MLSTSEFRDELQALKADAARLLGPAGEEMMKASRERADRFTEQLTAALNELGDHLGKEEQQLEKLVAERPIAALAGAFALGIIVGVVLRRI